LEFVSSFGYTCHWQVHPYFSQTNFRSSEVNIFPENANSINMLCFSRNDQKSVEKANNLPSVTRIDVASAKYLLHEYGLSYTGGEGTVLSQTGTLETCER
jgi:hypothetical protein